MDTPVMLLEQIYDLGERMCAALADGDVDGFQEAVQERGELLKRFGAARDAAQGTEAWEAVVARLREQHEELQVLTARYESRMQETLETMSRFKDARKSYAAPSSRGSILDSRLRI